jgi:hypothetical protein
LQRQVSPQVQVGPQVQVSPQCGEEVGSASGFWQPQVHWAPVQVSQAQAFGWVVMSSSFVGVDGMSTKRSVAPGWSARLGSIG